MLWVLALVCAYAHAHAVLPASLQPSETRPAEHAYVTTVYIGTPPEEMLLEVRFDVPGLWIYRDQSIHSASDALGDDGRQSDIVYFASERTRCYTHHGVPNAYLKSPLLCASCGGVLGMRSDSDVWLMWPDASFTASSITLGGKAPQFVRNPKDPHTWTLPCENGDADPFLCTVRMRWNGEPLRAALALHDSHIRVPRHVYNSYFEGKNLYENSVEWEPLRISFDVGQGGKDLAVALDRNDLSGQHGAEARELLITPKSPRNDTIVLGSHLLRRFALYRNAQRNEIIIHLHPTFSSLPAVNAILFLVLEILMVRWSLTNLGRHYARASARMSVQRLDSFYQLLGWGIAIASLLLDESWSVMQDIPQLHIAAIAIISVGIIIEAVVRYLLDQVAKRAKANKRPLTKPMPDTVLLVYMESMWHTVVLTTAMWILVAPRRREDLAGPLTAFVGGATLYILIMHLYLGIVFLALRPPRIFGNPPKRKSHRLSAPSLPLVLVAGISLVVLLAFYVIIFVWVFMIPSLTIITAIYSEMVSILTIFAVMVIAMASVIMIDSYIERAVKISVKQRIAAIEEARDRDAETHTLGQRAGGGWNPFFS